MGAFFPVGVFPGCIIRSFKSAILAACARVHGAQYG